MSFFGQGFPYHHPAAHAYPGRRAPYQPAPHYVHPSPPAYHDEYYGTYARPSYPYANDDLEEEERAAVAHLRAIQRRREAASAHIAREAELRAERELAFQAALQREREARERALERESERQRALKEERERAIRQRQEIARAEAFQALKARAIQAAKAKAYALAQAQAQQVARQAALAAQEKKRRYFQAVQAEQAEQARRRAACAGRCGRPAEKEENKEEDGLKVINDLLGGLFGINLTVDDTPAPATETKSAPASTKEKAPAPTTKVDAQPAKESKKPAETKSAAKDDSSAFPTEINDLLSHFLGLRVDPAIGNESAAGQPNKDVINGLNSLLGQWGLEFEPSPAEKTPKASGSGSTPPAAKPSSSKPAEAPVRAEESKSTPTPIADFLNGHYDIPPFVRDILSNVEVALTQGQDFNPVPEVKGKGKGVAEGEKTVRPTVPEVVVESATPAESTDSTSSTESIAKLDTISHELFLATESFEFPFNLAFAHPLETTELVPSLPFNKTNSAYHAQAHKLLQLLLAADGISSQGDKDVRQRRKEVVRAVEGAIEALEKKRDALWDQVKVRREAGEESEAESTSSAASTTSDLEHVERAELYETIPEGTATGYQADDKPQEAGEVVFDANEHTEPEAAPAVEVEEVAEEPKVEEKDETFAETPAEAEKVETEEHVEAENKDEAANAAGTSTPRSVTVEDQEEGYEVL